MFRFVFRCIVILVFSVLFLITILTTLARLNDFPTRALVYYQFRPGPGYYMIYSDPLRSLQLWRKTPLNNATLQDTYTMIAPGGQEYIVSRSSSRGVDLFIRTTDRSLQPLTSQASFPSHFQVSENFRFNSYPVWSPEGGWVAFVSIDSRANMDIYVISRDGQSLHRVAHDVSTPMPLGMHWTEISSQSTAANMLLLVVLVMVVVTARRSLRYRLAASAINIFQNRSS
jgi:hypothetical protein